MAPCTIQQDMRVNAVEFTAVSAAKIDKGVNPSTYGAVISDS